MSKKGEAKDKGEAINVAQPFMTIGDGAVADTMVNGTAPVVGKRYAFECVAHDDEGFHFKLSRIYAG